MHLGVEIGGTKLQFGVCDRRGRLVALRRLPVDRSGAARNILRQMSQEMSTLLAEYRVKAIGVGFGGPVDSATGRVVTSHQVAGWSGFPLRAWLEKQFRLPVVVQNDSKCATLAEARLGAGRGKRVVFYTNIGTGIGGGLAVDGKLYDGRFGSMEIGHTRIGEKTVESLASGLAIERGVSSIEEAARWYGAAIANAITLLNPDVVVVGGGVSLAGARFWRPLRQTVRRLVFPAFRNNFTLAPAALGERVVVIGAALVASERSRRQEKGV